MIRLYFITAVLIVFTVILNNDCNFAQFSGNSIEVLSVVASENDLVETTNQTYSSDELREPAEHTSDDIPIKPFKERVEEVRRKLQESGGKIKLLSDEEILSSAYEGLEGCEYNTETGQLTITDSKKFQESCEKRTAELNNRETQYKNTYTDSKSSTKQPHQFKLFSLETLFNIIGLVILYCISAAILRYRDRLREKKEQKQE